MSALAYVTGGVLSWLAVAIPVAALLGHGLRTADAPPATSALFDTVPLLHRCAGCGLSIQYFAFESLGDVQRIHDMLFCIAAPAEIRALREE